MVTRSEILRAVGLLAVFALVFLAMSTCQEKNWQQRTDAALDSAAASEIRVQINRVRAEEAETRANIAANESRAAQDSARRLRAEADRLRAARRVIVPVAANPDAGITVSDTLTAVRNQLDNCELETVSLRASHVKDSTALAKDSVTAAELRGSLASERKSVADLMKTVGDLTERVESADPPCRVLWMNCPTRKTVAVVSVVGSVLGTVLVINAVKQ